MKVYAVRIGTYEKVVREHLHTPGTAALALALTTVPSRLGRCRCRVVPPPCRCRRGIVGPWTTVQWAHGAHRAYRALEQTSGAATAGLSADECVALEVKAGKEKAGVPCRGLALQRSPLQARDSEAAEPGDTGIVAANGLLLLGVHLGLACAVETTQA